MLAAVLFYGFVLSWSKVDRSGKRVLDFRAVGPALTTHTLWKVVGFIFLMYMGYWKRFVEYVFHVSLNYLVTIANPSSC